MDFPASVSCTTGVARVWQPVVRSRMLCLMVESARGPRTSYRPACSVPPAFFGSRGTDTFGGMEKGFSGSTGAARRRRDRQCSVAGARGESGRGQALAKRDRRGFGGMLVEVCRERNGLDRGTDSRQPILRVGGQGGTGPGEVNPSDRVRALPKALQKGQSADKARPQKGQTMFCRRSKGGRAKEDRP